MKYLIILLIALPLSVKGQDSTAGVCIKQSVNSKIAAAALSATATLMTLATAQTGNLQDGAYKAFASIFITAAIYFEVRAAYLLWKAGDLMTRKQSKVIKAKE